MSVDASDGSNTTDPVDVLGPPEAEILHPVAGPKYNPEPRRENIRGILAIGSFALFVAVTLLILGSVAVAHRPWDQMEGATAVVLPAVTSVVASTLGFYFGTREGDKRS